jgi:DNA modification methylase
MMAKDYREENLYEAHSAAKPQGPVECLGMTFESNEQRRDYFLEKLRQKLQDPEFRKIEGFPIGSDKDILALSNPPYYTACPNPFIEDFISQYGKPFDPATDNYRREPFTADVSEGKTDPLYTAHAYHTKVPHKVIMRYILHYTEPGDMVFDGFCGTGMTGVAAQLCGEKNEVESLGYHIGNGEQILEGDREKTVKAISSLGARQAILNDLSPAATFIAASYSVPVDRKAFTLQMKRVLKELENECGWMYATLHNDGKTQGRINYTVWSDVFSCANCSKEIVFVREALDRETGSIRDTFPCPHCAAQSNKDGLNLLYETIFDRALGQTVSLLKRVPVFMNYTVLGTRYEKTPDQYDLELLERISAMPLPDTIPILELPDMQMRRVGRMKPAKISHVHQFFLPRAAHSIGTAWKLAHKCADPTLRQRLLFFVEQAIWTASVLNRFRPSGYSQVNQYLTGVFYVPSQHAECSPWYILEGKQSRLSKLFERFRPRAGTSLVTTQDLSTVRLPDNCVDYVFTDPPFGENIYYSDLNILIESWHKVTTATSTEAIVDRVKKKTLLDYQRMMQDCFRNYCRVLKPGRWMTVEFNNSRNSVWNAIQEALQHAGFVVADVRTLDKKQGSFQQVVSGNTVKRDLIISAYKPNGGLEDRFKLSAGTEEGAWDFIRTHLKQLPVFVSKDGRAEVIAERQHYLLFDRMVAFHVQRGVTVPLSAAEFYGGLEQRFSPRDGMYFLPEQVAEYDKKRLTVKEVLQLELFVIDESSAIQWLRQQLTRKPQTAGELNPQFMQEIGGWQKNEKMLELDEILEQNFLRYDGKGEVPSQIHSYLSTNFKELRNLPKDDPALRAKGKDRWYVPDPNKVVDREKFRERILLKEFQEYREAKQKRLKVFRLEAVRAGFKKAWQEHDYDTIIAVARKIPENVLQEDSKLLMWHGGAVTRRGEDK